MVNGKEQIIVALSLASLISTVGCGAVFAGTTGVAVSADTAPANIVAPVNTAVPATADAPSSAGAPVSTGADTTGSSNASAQTEAPTNSQTTNTGDQQVLHGGVRGAALKTLDGLTQIEFAAGDIQRSAMNIMAEVTRKETVVVRGPNVLPNSVVIPAFPGPSGTIQMGDLPPRKKRINAYMSELTNQVALLQNEMDALIAPEGEVEKDNPGAGLNPKWSKAREVMSDIKSNYDQLTVLTAGPKYKNEPIGRLALNIHDQVSSLHRLCAELSADLNKH